MYPKFRKIEPNWVKVTMRARRVDYSINLKVKWGYISAQKVET